MLSRTIAAVFLSMLLGCGGPQVKHRTTEENASVPPKLVPISPLIFDYTVWDHHFMQWLSDASPYEMVELLAKEQPDGPQLWILLTERSAATGSKRQVHLVNQLDIQRTLTWSRGDREVHLTQIRYERQESEMGCRLRVQAETPLGRFDWVFTSQGPPAAQHGNRLIDAAEAAHDLTGGLLVFYLEQSALSTEHTRFSLDDREEPVSEWSVLSRPPHFTAYRGVYSRPVHVGYFPSLAPTTVKLQGSGRPAQLATKWSYLWQTAGQATPEALRVTGTVQGVNWVFASERFVHKARRSDDEFLTTELSAIAGDRAMTLSFNPPVADLLRMRPGRVQSVWELTLGGKRQLFGDLLLSKTSRGIGVRFEPRAPAWARRLPLVAHITPIEGGYVYESQTELTP